MLVCCLGVVEKPDVIVERAAVGIGKVEDGAKSGDGIWRWEAIIGGVRTWFAFESVLEGASG